MCLQELGCRISQLPASMYSWILVQCSTITDRSCRLFNVFVTKLLSFKFLQSMPQPGVKRPVLEDDEVGICTYYLQSISTILKYSTTSMLSSLATEAVVRGNEDRENKLQLCKGPLLSWRGNELTFNQLALRMRLLCKCSWPPCR
jgi:hypothetical protein